MSVTLLTDARERRHLRIHGSEDAVEVRLDRKLLALDQRDGPTVTWTDFPDPSPQPWSRGHYHLLEEYLARLERDSGVPVPLEDDRDVVRVFEAVEAGDDGGT